MNTNTFLNAKDAKSTRNSQKESQNFEDDFSNEIIGAAVEVQRVLGAGLLESAYAAALALELHERELGFVREAPIESFYKGKSLGVSFKADCIVESSVIIEIKAQANLLDIHRAQLLSYLRASGLRLGLLINFHDLPLTKTVKRIVNHL
jgi:GxxExxY protein